MVPLAIEKIEKKEILDICSAPGGKAFQVLLDNNVILNDISIKRISKLKENLSRLKFNTKITNLDGLNLEENKKFDLVILDSPCSSIGTIRKHPEILFRSNKPDFKKLNMLQTGLLNKSSKLVKKNGKIIYMVCSFFQSETLDIINNFLLNNKNFRAEKYGLSSNLKIKNLINKDGYFLTAPTEYKGYYIDGFFSIQLRKND